MRVESELEDRHHLSIPHVKYEHSSIDARENFKAWEGVS